MQGLTTEWVLAFQAAAWAVADLLDAWTLASALPLGVYMIASGLDDLFITLVMVLQWLRGRWNPRPKPDLTAVPEKLIAVVLPLWQEAEVITGMVEHNLAAIDYSSYVVFAGVYPNDRRTMDAVKALEKRFPRVQMAVCPHPGPTSKADCLNWIYQRLLLHEEEHHVRFEVLVTHDAEDLVHPLSLRTINYYSDRYAMVQVPVIALPTPAFELTHGMYCDEFAEFQLKDMRARQALGSFIPSNGVGTGYQRAALERLAETRSNRIFEPHCLTEDYENGLSLAELGFAQIFVPLEMRNGVPVATREYFPRTFSAAVRQRTRWVTGNALQAWERHGWSRRIAFSYWMWRDRKGLLGNPLSIITNLLCFHGILTWLWAEFGVRPWGLGAMESHSWVPLTFALQVIATSVRMGCVARVYGCRFAAGVPVRTVWANTINSLSTVKALWRYSWARLRGRPLVWVKTEHAYPSRATLLEHRRPLEELLVVEGLTTDEDIEEARHAAGPKGSWTDWLVAHGRLDEDEFYEVLSLQQTVPLLHPSLHGTDRRIARSLPAHVLRECGVLPLEIRDGALWLGSPTAPSDDWLPKLKRFTRLDLRFALVTRSTFEAMKRELL